MDKYIGKRLEGRYDIIELVGSGGMANVYRAHDVIDDQVVAVKILRDEFVDNSEFIRRFKNESKAIALLNHPNIVKVHDVNFTTNVHYIVMEFIDGISLKDFIRHKKVLSTKEAVHFSLQILNALQHAHDKGIVHRDIKPQNIMLLRTGQIKVTDFGIARFARSEIRTITDRAIGSVHYISPEQAMGENTDEKSDIYSVGVMLFEMLTGELPFEADTAVSVAIHQIQTQVQRPRELNPDIPLGVEEIVLHAMEKKAPERYQSAAEMIADIQRFQQNPGIRFSYVQQRQNLEEREAPAVSKRKSRTPFLKTLTVVTLAISLGTIGFVSLMVYLNNPFKQTPTTILQKMEGLRYEDIVSKHYPVSLVPSEVYNNDVPHGVVIEQKPKQGTIVKEGSNVRLQVSMGSQRITMPDLVGQPASRSLVALRDLGLVAEEEETRVFNDNVAVGCIITTDPSPGTVVASGTKVRVTVSKGTEIIPISVPDVRNLNENSARTLIESSGFVVGSVSYKASELPEGIVISQTPSPGDLQLEKTSISMVVSEGGMQTYRIPVPLPQGMNRDVLLRAWIGNTSDEQPHTVVDEITLNPAESGGFWSPSFYGMEDKQISVAIYIEGQLYMQYELDFATGEYWAVKDRRDLSVFQE